MATATRNGATSEAPVQRYVPPTPNVIAPVPIALDRERHLKMTLGAIKQIRDVTGIDFFSANPIPPEKDTPDNLAFILWACLRNEDPELTLEQVYELPGVELSNLRYINSRIFMLYGVSMPEPEEAKEGEGAGATNPNPPTG